jgi:hypothetical protein
LLRGMDRESYAKEVFEDLQRDRDAKVQAMIDRQGLPKARGARLLTSRPMSQNSPSLSQYGTCRASR